MNVIPGRGGEGKGNPSFHVSLLKLGQLLPVFTKIAGVIMGMVRKGLSVSRSASPEMMRDA